MATKKITELPFINTLSGSSVFDNPSVNSVVPVVLYGTTNQITVENFSKFTNLYAAQTGSQNTFTVQNIFNQNQWFNAIVSASTINVGTLGVGGNTTIVGTLGVTGNGTIGGDLVVNGKLTAQEVYTEITSASIIFESGSTKFGDDTGDKHQFTGSINVSGSVIYNGVILSNIDANTIERLQQTTQSLQVATASLQAFSSSVNDQLQRVYQTTQSLHVATASLQFHSASVDSQLLAIQQTTQSLQVATASLNAFTASQDGRNFIISQYTSSTDAHIVGISAFTSSQLAVNLGNAIYTASVDSHIVGISTYTASVRDTLARVHQSTQSLQVATASLQQFTASQDDRNFVVSQVTGSLIGITNGLMAFTAALDNTYATDVQLYQLYQATRSIELTTGSLIGITNGLMAFTAALDNTYATDAQLYQLYQSTRSLELHSGSMVGVTNGLMAYTASNTSLNTGLRGEVDGIEAYTASLKGAAIVSSSHQITNLGFITSSQSASFNFIGFNTSAGVSVGVGQLAWNNTDGTLDLGMKGGNVVQQIGQEIFYEVRNDTGIQIPNGTAVFANGVTAGSGRITAAPYTADGSIREVRFLGLATENISTGVNGFVTHFGYVRGLDTRGDVVSSIAVGDETWAVGDILYVHPTVAGKLTNVKPEHAITVAIIITRHQSVGVLFVRPSSGGHLEDIHDILINTGSLINGQVLSYNSTSGLWVNTNKLTGSYGIQGTLELNGDILGNVPLNTFTGSLRSEVNGIEAYTASLKGAAIVSSSQQITNYYKFAETASANTFYGNQTINGGLSVNGTAAVTITSNTAGNTTLNLISTNSANSGKLQFGGATFGATIEKNSLGANSGLVFNSYHGGAEGYTFQSNATDVMKLTSTGRLGLEVSTPDTNTKLHIADTANGYVGIRLSGSGDYTGTDWTLYASSDSAPSANDFIGIQNNSTTDGGVINYKLKVYKDGNVNIPNGNLVMGTSGKGIDFSATSNGGGTTDSELLNDYEEGTWTPTWTSAGGSIVTVGSPTTTGRYTKIGNVVHIWARIYTNSVSSPTGVVTVSGLPFTTNSSPSNQAMHLFTMNAVTGTLTGTPVIYFEPGTSTAKILNKIWNSTEYSGDIATYFDNDTWGYFHASYFV
jgi:hypothetical protein